MIYKIYDATNMKYIGYKTPKTLHELNVPFSVHLIHHYGRGITITILVIDLRTRTEKANTVRIALNNIIERHELLDQLNFNA
jgi:hypothetical protein